MNDMAQTIEEINISHFESCYTVGRHPRTIQTFRVNIPKLMPEISGGYPVSGTANTCRSAIINSGDTKPSMASQVSTQNYLSYDRLPNSNYGKSDENVIPVDIFEIGTRGILLFVNNDIRYGHCFEFY